MTSQTGVSPAALAALTKPYPPPGYTQLDHIALDLLQVDEVAEEQRAAALHEIQLERDREWLAAARADGFQGEVFNNAVDLLLSSTAAKLSAHIITGRIFQRSARLGRPTPATDEGLRQLRRSGQDLDNLTYEVLEKAWRRFLRDALIGGGWDPAKGRTLAGYLIGACELEFKDCYAKWLADFMRRHHVLDPDPMSLAELLRRESTGSQPQSQPFVLDEDAQQLLDRLPQATQQTVVLSVLGYSTAEIASILGVAKGTVGSRINRAKDMLAPHYPRRRSAHDNSAPQPRGH